MVLPARNHNLLSIKNFQIPLIQKKKANNCAKLTKEKPSSAIESYKSIENLQKNHCVKGLETTLNYLT